MESQFIWPLIGILIVVCITCISAAWMVSKAISELRGDIRVLDTRMDSWEKHLEREVNGLKEEVRGINEFLRRKPTTEDAKGKDS